MLDPGSLASLFEPRARRPAECHTQKTRPVGLLRTQSRLLLDWWDPQRKGPVTKQG
jgi:hypothetical protein